MSVLNKHGGKEISDSPHRRKVTPGPTRCKQVQAKRFSRSGSSLSPRARKKSPSPRGSVVQYDKTSGCYRIGDTNLSIGRDVVVGVGRGGRTNEVNGWLATLISNEYRAPFKGSNSPEEKRGMLRSIYKMVLDKGGNFYGPDGHVVPKKDVALEYIRKQIVGKASKNCTSPSLTPASSFEEEFSDNDLVEPILRDEIAVAEEDAEALDEAGSFQNDYYIEPVLLRDEIAVAEGAEFLDEEGEYGLQIICAMVVDDFDYEEMIHLMAEDVCLGCPLYMRCKTFAV